MLIPVKAVAEEDVSSENVYLYMLLVNDHEKVGSYGPITNKQTILNKPMSKLKLFKKYPRSRWMITLNDQKTRKTNAVFPREKNRKKKMHSSNSSYLSMDCIIVIHLA